MPEEPKAKVEIIVEYLGKEYSIVEDEVDVSYGLGDAILDVIAGLDCDIKRAREERMKLKGSFRRQ